MLTNHKPREGKVFTLTDEHIKLLTHMYVSWCDDEFGAPMIDPKRPYGDSDVLTDMCEILAVETDLEDDFYDLSDDERGRLNELHMETKTALQVVLRTGSFLPGTYVTSSSYREDWELEGNK